MNRADLRVCGNELFNSNIMVSGGVRALFLVSAAIMDYGEYKYFDSFLKYSTIKIIIIMYQ